MKDFIYPEMMVHIPLCSHKKPQNVLVMSNDASIFTAELARYNGVKVTTVAPTIDAARDLADASFDVVLLESSTDAALLAHVNRALRVDGMLTMQHPDLEEVQANTAIMQVLGNYFKIIMPYNVDKSTLLLASKEYHPTADIILHRTDLLEGQQFYNCDIHPAVFAMPNYIRKSYLGIIRN